jgi:formamidopyrimidine-DNA glycosylase
VPELPEVETVRRGLAHLITGYRITELLGDIAMNPGMYYVNLHTAKNADGAVRGQLKVGM